MSNPIATVQIDKATVEGIVERQIQAAIVRELDGTKDLLFERIVKDLINSRVNDRGEITKDSWNKTTLIEFLCREKIKQAASVALDRYFANQAPQIEAAMEKELLKQKKIFAKAAVDAMVKSVKSHYKYNFKIEVDENKE
jgi:hypothetical protein